MNRRTVVAGVAGLFTVPNAQARTTKLCDPGILRLIASTRQPVIETAEVFGCQRNHADGFEYSLIRATQTDLFYEAAGPDAVALVQSIDLMSMDDRFASSLRYDRARSEVVTRGANSTVNLTFIGDESIMFHDNWMNNVRKRHFDNFEAYALANRLQEADLWDYMGWFILRRDITLEVLSANMNPLAAPAWRDAHNYGYLPWPWQLTHVASIQSYLAERSL